MASPAGACSDARLWRSARGIVPIFSCFFKTPTSLFSGSAFVSSSMFLTHCATAILTVVTYIKSTPKERARR